MDTKTDLSEALAVAADQKARKAREVAESAIYEVLAEHGEIAGRARNELAQAIALKLQEGNLLAGSSALNAAEVASVAREVTGPVHNRADFHCTERSIRDAGGARYRCEICRPVA